MSKAFGSVLTIRVCLRSARLLPRWALERQKSISPLFPGPKGAVVANDWCIMNQIDNLSFNKGLVRPVLEYGSSVWDPHTLCLQEELEKVQNRAARFVTGNHVFEPGS